MKKGKIIIILALANFIYNNGISQLLWPLDPQYYQHRIVGTIGEFRSGSHPHFHSGVDIGPTTPGDEENVLATAAGKVYYEPGVASNGHFNAYMWIGLENREALGNIFYWHTRADASIFQGKQVNIGDKIGIMSEMRDPVKPHTHLQYEFSQMNNINLISNLNLYTDLAPPVILDSKFYKNGVLRSTSLSDLQQKLFNDSKLLHGISYKILYHKIDIITEVRDPRTSADGTAAGGSMMPYATSFEILNNKGSTVLGPIENVKFDFAPENDKLDYVFAPNASLIEHRIIITNNPFVFPTSTDFDRYWNTGLRRGEVDTWPNNTSLDASYPGNAEYLDDIYTVRIKTRDIDHDETFNYNVDPEEKHILLDNFMPYIEKVRLIQEDNQPYSESWVWDESQSKLVFDIGLLIHVVGGNKNLTVNVFTSEPMKDLFIKGPNASDNPQPLQAVVNTNNRQWRYTITAENLSKITENEIKISFTGHDYADNQLLKHPGDNMPLRQLNGTWVPAPDAGVDNNFKFHFCAKPTDFHSITMRPHAIGLDWEEEWPSSFNQFIFNSNFNWISCTNKNKPNFWTKLKPSTEYKVKMSNNCTVNQFTVVSAESDVISFTTPPQN